MIKTTNNYQEVIHLYIVTSARKFNTRQKLARVLIKQNFETSKKARNNLELLISNSCTALDITT